MLIHRNVEDALLAAAKDYPVVSITGPRQSGKTTLARETFPDYEYVSLENPDVLQAFRDDPNTFLHVHSTHVIFDEAQRAPQLFSYLQQVVDSSRETGRFVITGSQNFLLMDAIGQSLAGRVELLTLLPLSYNELSRSHRQPSSLEEWLFQGGYPRVYDASILPNRYFPNYIQTYLERDARTELGVRRLHDFQLFLQLCALRTSQQLNVSNLASSAGIAFNTAKEWLSILEASGIIYLLEPYFSNRGKSLVKSPKLYFIDTGLAASLMGIRAASELSLGEFRGPLFETYVVSEVLKAGYEQGQRPQLSYWRDTHKNEADLIVRHGLKPVQAIEIKSSATYNARYFDILNKVGQDDLELSPKARAVVYGGTSPLHTQWGDVVPFRDVHDAAIGWLS